MLQAKVVDLWDSSKGWDWSILKPLLNEKACSSIVTKRLVEGDRKQDGICWGYEESGLFTIKLAYALTRTQDNIPTDGDWQRIWNISTLFFLEEVMEELCTR